MKRQLLVFFVLALMTVSAYAATPQPHQIQPNAPGAASILTGAGPQDRLSMPRDRTAGHSLTANLLAFRHDGRSATVSKQGKFDPSYDDDLGDGDQKVKKKWRGLRDFEMRGVIEKIRKNYLEVSGKSIIAIGATWLGKKNQPVAWQRFKVGDRIEVKGTQIGKAIFAKTIQWMGNPNRDGRKVALLFVGHGEPRTAEDGDVSITLADGEPFGPHADSLGVPSEFQYTEWAAAYDEIATAMTYIFEDLNGNGIPHEMEIVPAGDVPGFFTWDAFHASVYAHYAACENFSPHNDALIDHVENLEIKVKGADIDIYIAFLDAVPRIRDVLWGMTEKDNYEELVVVPLLLASSTHTTEVADLVEESAHLTSGMEVVVVEPLLEVPFTQRRIRDAVISMVDYVRGAIPGDVADHNIGVVLASHGTPYVPPLPIYGWQEGEIYSNLIPTEDLFHAKIASRLPWMTRTGRMSYSSPTIKDALSAFEADGFTHVMVVPSAFPTAAIHTMWDVADAAVGRAVLPKEGVVEHTRPSGMKVYYSAEGFADTGVGRQAFQDGLSFMGKIGVLEALEEAGDDSGHDITPYVECPPGELCVTVSADQITGGALKYMLYATTDADWPGAYEDLPTPDWVVMAPPPMPDRFPARIRIPLDGNLLPISGETLEGARLGLAIVSGEGETVKPTDARGFSPRTSVYQTGDALNFGAVDLQIPQQGTTCLAGEICVTVTAQETTGPDLKLMLYTVSGDDWPQDFQSLPTPSAVVTQTVPVPEDWPIHIRIPMEGNIFTFSGALLEGSRLGLAVVTGVASTFVVEPTDARGFSSAALVYQPDVAMNYGDVEVKAPRGDPCELNPYNPDCLSGPLFWEEHALGEQDLVPGAIYMDVADIDGDGTHDIVMVGEPHFEEPERPLTDLKLGVYYLNADASVRETEIIDAWSETDPLFYSPWGVRVIQHAGKPMIVVGCNIPGLAPLEEGTGAVLSYHRDGGAWVRAVVRDNPNPTEENYNAMIVVPADIDKDGDEDLALSGAFGTSAVGSWMENTGDANNPWKPHLLPMIPGTDPHIRGTLAYKSADLNGDGYPEVVYNAMFDIPDTDPPRYRGEIWLGINPGPSGWDSGESWPMVVIDDDNWAAADMWFHDFDDDGDLDLVANQIFNSTVTLYHHPGADLNDIWVPRVIIEGLTSPSDMWLADMDKDGRMDVVSADHTVHRGVWHKNPGPDVDALWQPHLIYRNVRLPGDFAMIDVDGDSDLDWVGTSMTMGQAFIVKQIAPESGLVATIAVPDDFDGTITKLQIVLASGLPLTGMPDAILATIENKDSDDDGEGDVDQILGASRDLVLALEDVQVSGDYHVMAVLYMEGGGTFQPVSGIDYLASSEKLTLGQGKADVVLNLEIVP